MALVTGATGAVGPAVVCACLQAGYAVRAFSVDRPDPGVLPPEVDVRIGDVCDADAVRAGMRGVDCVLHLAALLHQFKNTTALEGEFQRINVGGTENVVRAATAEGVRRIVFLSTIAVYGPSRGQLLDENAPPAPDTTYGRTKLEAERLVLSARTGGRTIGTVLRAAAVYGSRIKGNYRTLAESIARRRFVPVGPGLNRRTMVHDSDLARATVLAFQHEAAPGAVFNVSDGQVHTLADIIQAIYRALDRRPPRFRIPVAPVRAAAGLCEDACRLLGVPAPITRSVLEKYTEDVAVDGGRLQRVLGFAPLMNLDAGWRETLTFLRSSGRRCHC